MELLGKDVWLKITSLLWWTDVGSLGCCSSWFAELVRIHRERAVVPLEFQRCFPRLPGLWGNAFLEAAWRNGAPLVVGWMRQQKDIDDVVKSLSHFLWRSPVDHVRFYDDRVGEDVWADLEEKLKTHPLVLYCHNGYCPQEFAPRLGNRLAKHVGGGGCVVLTGFATCNVGESLSGEFTALLPFSCAGQTGGLQGGRWVEREPLFQLLLSKPLADIGPFQYHGAPKARVNGGTLVAAHAYHGPEENVINLIAYRPHEKGLVIALNVFPPSVENGCDGAWKRKPNHAEEDLFCAVVSFGAAFNVIRETRAFHLNVNDAAQQQQKTTTVPTKRDRTAPFFD